ncbi:MAG: NDP-sugar synthase [Elusimicrobiota bacterium]
MQAFVMAAGAGTRLRPLTHSIPKPMFPIANKPVMAYTMDLLKNVGITQVAINLFHHPAMIKNYFDKGRRWGMEIVYSEEDKLMGTAGGVKLMEKFFKDSFVVMSGDGLTDVDLKSAIDFHRQKKSLATMVLKPIDARFEYGVTLTDKEGRIKKFIEKPAWSDVFANTVNTGIYILEKEIFNYIPKRAYYDFGHDLWPLLLKKKQNIFAYVMSGYWCDIGNLSEYRRSSRDLLEGKIGVSIPGEKIGKNIWVGKGTKLHRRARLNGPCVIGDHCEISADVLIDEYTVIGHSNLIEKGAKLKNCILWNDVRVEKNVELNNCIIGNNGFVSENISVFEGSVINVRS